jgi:hypothetical protein
MALLTRYIGRYILAALLALASLAVLMAKLNDHISVPLCDHFLALGHFP